MYIHRLRTLCSVCVHQFHTYCSSRRAFGRQLACLGCPYLTCDRVITVLKLWDLGFSLPASYSNLVSLTTLAVANNKLVGSIPPSWDVVADRLSSLDLSENQLTGLPAPSMTICFALSLQRVCMAAETD